MTSPEGTATSTGNEEELPEPSFSEQIAAQLGGVWGLVESSVPVAVFVIVNLAWSLRPAVIGSVVLALVIAAFRLSRRQPVRHALNGLFAIGLGALIASRTGEAKDFHLPTIFYATGYALALLLSVFIRRPLVGWIWSVTFAGGSARWRTEARLLRAFGWLTVLWAVVYLTKVAVLGSLYLADQDDALGVARLAFGYPPYAFLLVVTVYVVRRATRHPAPEPG